VERLHKDLLELFELFELFGSNNVDYLIVGGHAVAFHGHPRFTEYLDCFVRPSIDNGSRIVEALRAFGFGTLGIEPSDFVSTDHMIQLPPAPHRVDLLTRLYDVSFDEAWATKVHGSLDGVPVWFIDRDSLLRNKRATGRPRDIADAEFLERLQAVSRAL
jgi:hypothetical protein